MTAYIESEFAQFNSKNKLRVEYLHGGKPWVADVNHWNFEAARKAIEVRTACLFRHEYVHALTSTQAVWNKTPDYTREGGSIPVTLTFAEKLGVNVLLLPMGRADDGAQYVVPLFHCHR